MSIFKHKKNIRNSQQSLSDTQSNTTVEGNSVYFNLEEIALSQPKILRSKYEPSRLIIVGLDKLPDVVDCYLSSDRQSTTDIGAIRYTKEHQDL